MLLTISAAQGFCGSGKCGNILCEYGTSRSSYLWAGASNSLKERKNKGNTMCPISKVRIYAKSYIGIAGMVDLNYVFFARSLNQVVKIRIQQQPLNRSSRNLIFGSLTKIC
jgi:hypothetical protein